MSSRFGKYWIDGKVAVGGMAEIYLAHTTSGQVVAVKKIHPNFAKQKKFIQMFLDEARIVVSLRHPNVVQLYDFGKVQDTYFFSMEWVDGKSLGDVFLAHSLAAKPFPIPVVLWMMIDVCSGLDYAHQKTDRFDRHLNLVHRDISPPNILITKDCVTKVADFGIARVRDKGLKTQPGVIRGKFSYMSPEQSWGEELDCRSDLFSLGIVFYEMLMSNRLFLRRNEVETLEAVRKCHVPAPRAKRPEISPVLASVVKKILSKDPNHRFNSAQEFALALGHVLATEFPNSSRQDVADYLSDLFPDGGFHARPNDQDPVLMYAHEQSQVQRDIPFSALALTQLPSSEVRYLLSATLALVCVLAAEALRYFF